MPLSSAPNSCAVISRRCSPLPWSNGTASSLSAALRLHGVQRRCACGEKLSFLPHEIPMRRKVELSPRWYGENMSFCPTRRYRSGAVDVEMFPPLLQRSTALAAFGAATLVTQKRNCYLISGEGSERSIVAVWHLWLCLLL